MKRTVALFIAMLMFVGCFAFANTAAAEEPVKGGTLVNLPEAALKEMTDKGMYPAAGLWTGNAR